jgi:hypothetical protein
MFSDLSRGIGRRDPASAAIWVFYGSAKPALRSQIYIEAVSIGSGT